jgi:hypothetical protein
MLLPLEVRPLSSGSVALPLAAAAARPPLLARLPLALLPADALPLRRPRLDCSRVGGWGEMQADEHPRLFEEQQQQQ